MYVVLVFSNLKTYKVKAYNLLLRQREYSFNPSYMHTLTNSEDPDEMLHNAVFHQGLPCLLSKKQYLVKEIQFYLEIQRKKNPFVQNGVNISLVAPTISFLLESCKWSTLTSRDKQDEMPYHSLQNVNIFFKHGK